MNQVYDLHCHTNLSDGALSPAELVQRAAHFGVQQLAITDHDTIAALAPAQAAIAEQQLALQLITGVELTCRWQNHEIHLVALNFDPEHTDLVQLLEQQQQQRRDRYAAMVARLDYLGLAITPPAVQQLTMPTRKHLADALVEQGKVSSVEAAFQRYLGAGKLAYIKAQWVELEQAIAVVKAAGGYSIIAHPHAYQLSNKWLRRLFSEGKDAGLDGIEVAIGAQAPGQREALALMANDLNLAASVGSDFHAPLRWRELGKNLCLPPSCVPIWTQWSANNK